MKKVVKLISLLLATMVFVTGCKSDTDVKSNEVKTSKKTSEYINLTMIRASTINPILNTDKSVSYVLDLVYDSLFELDENYNIQPKLVESYSISSNNKKIDITLKDNIKWHDGESLTAKDVKYTYELINENKDSAYNSLVSNISGITVHGSKKLTINFKDSYAFSLETLIFPIVSKDKLDGLKTDELKLAKNNLVGSGDYKIKKYEDRDYMILELNNGQLEDKIVTIGYGSNEVDFKKLQEEVSKRINAKKVYITRGGSCICSHTGPEILAISSSY